MAIYNAPDGRQVVGSTTAGNDYHGFNGKRDIIIQLTADGATTDGLNALEYLKAYAVEQNKQNNPIFPSGTRVWISANGYTKAVEADDIVIDGENVTIGGIEWNGSAWDFSNAGQTGGTGLPTPTSDDIGKVATVVGETSKGAVVAPEQSVEFDEPRYGNPSARISNLDSSLLTIGALYALTVDGAEYTGTYDGVSLVCGIFTITEILDGFKITADSADYSEATATISLNLASVAAAWGLASSGGVLVVSADFDTGALDKTWQEIHDGGFGVVKIDSGNEIAYMPIVSVYSGIGTYGVTVIYNGDTLTAMDFTASSASGYPVAVS